MSDHNRPRVKNENYDWDTVLLEWVPHEAGAAASVGGSTAANQVLEIAALNSIDGKLPALVGGRVPVVLPAGAAGLTDAELRASAVPTTDAADRTLGAAPGAGKILLVGALQQDSLSLNFGGDGNAELLKVDASGALYTDDVNSSLYLPSIDTSLTAINGKTPALGQATMANSSPVVIASNQSALSVTGPLTDVQLRATPVPVSGTVTTAPPANASTNLAQIVGTAADVNSGLKSAGTLRVVIATDQPALTNKLLVTPDSVALPANQSVNISQIAGVTPSLNTGVRDAGTLRVTVATNDVVPISAATLPLPTGASTLAEQQTQTTALQLIDNIVSGAGANITQLGGVNVSMNTGVRDAGTQRVTIATNDSVPVTGTVAVTGPLTNAELRAAEVPVSVAALPLPAGAATAALQTTGNTSLASIDAKVPSLVVDTLGVSRIPVETEASDYDIGGAHVINVIDRQQRRMHEIDMVANYVAAMQAMIATEWESSQRMGFEIR